MLEIAVGNVKHWPAYLKDNWVKYKRMNRKSLIATVHKLG